MNNPEQKPQSETAPEREPDIGDQLASFGNNENKALLLISMRPDVTYSEEDLRHLLLELQGSEPAWDPGNRIAFQYCRDSLAPVGFVSEAVIERGRGIAGFRKTSFGVETGDAVAGQLLELSRRHPETSLRKLFTETHKPEAKEDGNADRPPMHRLMVLTGLLTIESTNPSQAEVIEATGLKEGTVANVLRSLDHDGILTYEATKKGNTLVNYEVPAEIPSNIELYKSRQGLSQKIIEVLQKRPGETVSAVTIAEDLGIDKEQNEPQYKWVSRILKNFSQQQAIRVEKFSGNRLSKISVSEKQRELIEDMIDTVYSIYSGDPKKKAEGKRLADQFRADKSLSRELVEKAVEDSPFIHRRDVETSFRSIEELLEQHGRLESEQIYELLKERGSRHKLSTVRYHLTEMARAGRLQKTESKYETTWDLPKAANAQRPR